MAEPRHATTAITEDAIAVMENHKVINYDGGDIEDEKDEDCDVEDYETDDDDICNGDIHDDEEEDHDINDQDDYDQDQDPPQMESKSPLFLYVAHTAAHSPLQVKIIIIIIELLSKSSSSS